MDGVVKFHRLQLARLVTNHSPAPVELYQSAPNGEVACVANDMERLRVIGSMRTSTADKLECTASVFLGATTTWRPP